MAAGIAPHSRRTATGTASGAPSVPGEVAFCRALAHPAFEPLRPWLGRLGHQWPDCGLLNSLAADRAATAGGISIRFQPPAAEGARARRNYEQRIFDTGLVETRPHNLHDLFNALVWIAFPRAKAAINARHAARLRLDGSARGPLGDLLTLIDEGGVLVACEKPAQFEPLVRGFQWQEMFWARRASLIRSARFVLLGHSAFEKALAPYAGITCKAVFLRAPRDLLQGRFPDLVEWLDDRAARWVQALPALAAPKHLAPLPVFGYPGWLPGSQSAEFYADRRWFRPRPDFAGRRGAHLSAAPDCV